MSEDRKDTPLGTLWICGKPWAVSISGESLYDDDGTVIGGETDTDMDLTITINGRFSEASQAAVLLHEIDHAKVWAYSREGHERDEERCARAHEAADCSILCDERNDWMWVWVKRRLRGDR